MYCKYCHGTGVVGPAAKTPGVTKAEEKNDKANGPTVEKGGNSIMLAEPDNPSANVKVVPGGRNKHKKFKTFNSDLMDGINDDDDGKNEQKKPRTFNSSLIDVINDHDNSSFNRGGSITDFFEPKQSESEPSKPSKPSKLNKLSKPNNGITEFFDADNTENEDGSELNEPNKLSNNRVEDKTGDNTEDEDDEDDETNELTSDDEDLELLSGTGITDFIVGGRKSRGGKKKRVGRGRYDSKTLFSSLRMSANDCTDPNAVICSSGSLVKEIAQNYSIDKTDPQEVIEEAKKKTKCDSEVCVVKKTSNRSSIAKRELLERFKNTGPKTEDNTWLNNHNIDGVLLRWMLEFPDFMACPFAMRDFDKTMEPFSQLKLPDVYTGEYAVDLGIPGSKVRKAKIFACVLNTDVSTGPGIHWVAVVVDMRTETPHIFYFNSTGNKAFKEIRTWQARTAKELKDSKLFNKDPVIKDVTEVQHQKENVVCGLYSLYFIRYMLTHKTEDYEFFTNPNNEIVDNSMNEFRRMVFSS